MQESLHPEGRNKRKGTPTRYAKRAPDVFTDSDSEGDVDLLPADVDRLEVSGQACMWSLRLEG